MPSAPPGSEPELSALPPWTVVLRAVHEARGITREGWAARLGYSAKTVQRWERGVMVPDALAEAAFVTLARDEGLLRRYTSGPLHGHTLTDASLRRLLADARSGKHATPQPLPLLHLVSEPATVPPPNTLPAALTSFVGREQELAAIRALLTTSRLVTLTGPGGTGKTRLAIEAARPLGAAFPDGVWLVSLAGVRDPAQVAVSLAQTLSIAETSGQPVLTGLRMVLHPKMLLLVLDNFEQVVAAGPDIAALLEVCPQLRVLVTSRALLHLSGEREYPVAPLALPPQAPPLALDALLGYAAVALFVQRAQEVRPEFALTAETAPAIIEICRRLDGLPLALELAAARSKLLSPQALLGRLGHRLQLLTGGPRNLPPRQQTLRDTIAWSYDLLPPAEQLLFRRLAVFAGGCTLEAAGAVCGELTDPEAGMPGELLDRLTTLVDTSLLLCHLREPDGEPRFAMLETIREFAVEQLEASREAEDIRQRHAAYFLRFAEAAAPQAHIGDAERGLVRLALEHDNLRSALEQCRAADNEAELRLALALTDFWWKRGHLGEGRTWLEDALRQTAAAGSTPARASALQWVGTFANHASEVAVAVASLRQSMAMWQELGNAHGYMETLFVLGFATVLQGDFVQAKQYFVDSERRARAAGVTLALVRSLMGRSYVAIAQGDYPAARACSTECVMLCRAGGDRFGLADALNCLGDAARCAGDSTAALQAYTESLALTRALGNERNTPATLRNLACVLLAQGDHPRAAALLAESLQLHRAAGNVLGVAECYVGCAALAVVQGQAAQAAQLLGAADALWETLHRPVWPAGRVEYEQTLATVRAALGQDAFTTARVAGVAYAMEHAIEGALAVATASAVG